MDALWSALQNLPGGPVPWLAVMLALGAILWVFGHRLLKPTFAGIGFVCGFFGGYAAAATFDLGVPPWLAAIVLSMAMAVIACFTYRLAIAIICAFALGAIFPTAVWTANEHGLLGSVVDKVPPMPDRESLLPLAPAPGADVVTDEGESSESMLTPDSATSVIEAIHKALEESETRLKELGETEVDEDQTWIDRVSAWSAEVGNAAYTRWQAASPPLRTLLLASAAVGMFLGLVSGLIATKPATMLATAAAGGVLITLSGAGIAQATLQQEFLTDPSRLNSLLAIWLGVSCLGLVIQAKSKRKPADNNG